MKLLFRVDASEQIGSGHLMRCLTLADAAAERGWECLFIVRAVADTHLQRLEKSRHKFSVLRHVSVTKEHQTEADLPHSAWLPVSRTTDAIETAGYVGEFSPDWVIVDHYALDAVWHSVIRQYCDQLLVIDDVADRSYDCTALLDQNFGAVNRDYDARVIGDADFLLGPNFALIRREFSNLRIQSSPRQQNKVNRVLVNFGGVDAENFTCLSLIELESSKFAKYCDFVIVVGAAFPHKKELLKLKTVSELAIEVLVDVEHMAELMSTVDLCIGATGSTVWERCCVGLPTLALAIADNQVNILAQLADTGAVFSSDLSKLSRDFDSFFSTSNNLVSSMSLAASNLCDGLGAYRVLDYLQR